MQTKDIYILYEVPRQSIFCPQCMKKTEQDYCQKVTILVQAMPSLTI